jgi:two-component system sensor histidine kinase KdpD
MLLLARFQGAVMPEPEPVAVARVAELLTARLQRAHAEREFRIVQHGAPLAALCVPVYLERVLENLLSNATKYSPPNTPITIDIRSADRFVEVRVIDEGTGVSRLELQELFTPFYRAAEHAATTPGIGIGLTVCQRLVEAQGGTIWARRAEGGVGSEFGFTIPSVNRIEEKTDARRAAALID